MSPPVKTSVIACESQPLTAEGIKAVLAGCPDLELCRVVGSISAAVELLRHSLPAVLILDKAFGSQAVLDCLSLLRTTGQPTAAVVWGVSMTDAEALRFVQAGAKGVVRKTAGVDTLLVCLRAVAAGTTWLEQGTVGKPDGTPNRRYSELTARERQVLELVGQGLKNREIAAELGIQPGTVKVHLKHIFEKTGIRSRYGLALAGLGARPEGNLPAHVMLMA